jgi:hypothetical protein
LQLNMPWSIRARQHTAYGDTGVPGTHFVVVPFLAVRRAALTSRQGSVSPAVQLII